MKIGIDYHGVINSNPGFFKKFADAAIQKKHDIIILTGSKATEVQAYLTENKIPFCTVYSLLDDFTNKKSVQFYEDGSFFVNNELWNKAKADFCLQNKIDIHIDDSMLYGAYFQTPFCLYNAKRKSCTFAKQNITINFNQTPEKVLDDLENMIQKINSN